MLRCDPELDAGEPRSIASNSTDHSRPSKGWAPQGEGMCDMLDVSRQIWYSPSMILSYRDKRTESFANGEFVREFQGFTKQANKRLEILEAAISLEDLRALPSNRLEALRGNRAGHFSIRINQQWRMCFKWPQGANGSSEIEIVDYH